MLGVDEREALYREPLWLPEDMLATIFEGARWPWSLEGEPFTEGAVDGATEVLESVRTTSSLQPRHLPRVCSRRRFICYLEEPRLHQEIPHPTRFIDIDLD